MEKVDLYSQYQQIKDHKVLVSFKGAISQEVLSEFGSMIRSSLSAETNTKKIFAVFIELAQNIVHYSSERQTMFGSASQVGIGIIILREKLDHFSLSAGNFISNDTVEKVKLKCEKVNSMNKDELKAYYQEQIKSPRKTESSKGAGLGLIDIARKADGPIECTIDPIDNSNSFLTLSVIFKKENQ